MLNKQKEYYIYLLECADHTYYCGYTNDIEKRLISHNSRTSRSKYTRSRQPVTLVYYEKVSSKSQALKRELQVKLLSRIQKQALVNTHQENLIK